MAPSLDHSLREAKVDSIERNNQVRVVVHLLEGLHNARLAAYSPREILMCDLHAKGFQWLQYRRCQSETYTVVQTHALLVDLGKVVLVDGG